MFEIEIYKSILFLHCCLPPVTLLPFHASFRRHAAVIFTFREAQQDAGLLPSAWMSNHHYMCCQLRCIEICIYECIVPYACERDGGQEVCMAECLECAPFATPSPSLHICHFHPLLFPLSLFTALFLLISVVPLLPVNADLGECEPADGELCWLRRCHPRWWEFQDEGKTPSFGCILEVRQTEEALKLWHILFLWCWNGEKKGGGGGAVNLVLDKRYGRNLFLQRYFNSPSPSPL